MKICEKKKKVMNTHTRGLRVSITESIIQLSIGQYSAFSFSNPVYEPGAPSGNPPGSAGPTYKVEDVVVRARGSYGTRTSRPWSGIKSKPFLAYNEISKLLFSIDFYNYLRSLMI